MEEKIIIQENDQEAKVIPIILLVLGAISLIICVGIISTGEGWYLLIFAPLTAVLLISSITLFVYCCNCSICVTDKRVYGKARFGARVDLPIDAVSAVAVLPIWKGISVSTSSGAIKFIYVKNANEIHAKLSELLVTRQSRNGDSTVLYSSTNADELKKYKELLDSGVITEEEFNAKKKQLLGL